MGKIISITNQKGGVGKTTTAINLATSLAYYGKDTLIIDMDPQANATSGIGIEKNSIKKSIYDILLEKEKIKETIIPTAIEWLDIVPSHLSLIGAEVELVSLFQRETRLANALKEVVNSYDYIFIDCPPSLGLLTINSLSASDCVMIPIQCEYYALEGLGQLMHTLELVKKHLNPTLKICGVLLTMFDIRVNLSSQVVEEVRKFFGDKVYSTIIPRNIRISEAPGFGKPVLLYDANSKGAIAYLNLGKEFLSKNNISTEE